MGSPLTADDFIFSFNLIKDPEYHPMYKEYFKDIKSIEKIDAHTVRYHFAVYNQELPLITGQMLIFPKHVYTMLKEKSFGSRLSMASLSQADPTQSKNMNTVNILRSSVNPIGGARIFL